MMVVHTPILPSFPGVRVRAWSIAGAEESNGDVICPSKVSQEGRLESFHWNVLRVDIK